MSQISNINKEIQPNTTVIDLLMSFQDRNLSPDIPANQSHIKCDYCSSKIHHTKDIELTQYLADDILNSRGHQADLIHKKRPFVQLSTYCEDCSQELLFFPCKDFSEVRIKFNLTENWTIKYPSITDISNRDEGINWNPKEVMQEITGISFDKREIMGNELWGPENIFTVLDAAFKTVDMDELINYEGSLNDDILIKAKKEYRQFQYEMIKDGYDEDSFTDYVKDK